MKRLKEHIADLEYAIPIMRDRGSRVDEVEFMLRQMKAIMPNKETRIDLHDKFLVEAALPIYPLYVTKLEVYALQTIGFVPERNTEQYKSLLRSFRISEAD